MPERKYYRKIYSQNKKIKKSKKLLKYIFFAFLFFIFSSLFLFIFYAKDLPRPEKFTEKQLVQSTKIYDRTGNVLLYEVYGEEKRTIVSLETIPDFLKKAVIVAEDDNFYHHFGVDFEGIFRSVLANLKIGKPIHGGSTISQQLIRSTFLTPEKTMERKIREIILSLELDRRYSKDQILEWYLNQVPFGSNCYGAESASQTYFEKPVSEISLAEAALLASLIKAPSRLSPYGQNKDDLLKRKDYILDRLAEENFFNKEVVENAKKEDLNFSEKKVQIKAPYFTLWIKEQLVEKYSEDFLRKKGLKVFTTLDWELQQEAEKITKEIIERNKSFNAYNAGLVAIAPKTGDVLAMTVGTGDYYAQPIPEDCISGANCLFDPKFNVVVGTNKNPGRQPGSAFKPFVYATAFKKGFDDKTTVIDEKTNFGEWGGKDYVPQNYDGLFRGEITLRESLAQSINVTSVKVLLDMAGLEDSVQTAKNLGITTLSPPYGPAIVLGGWEVKLLEITSAYGVFAAEGLKTSPYGILKIEDQQGNILEENKKMAKRVLPAKAAVIINDILSDNEARTPMFGPNSALHIEGYQVAVKTGTTQDYRDAWTIGYAPSISVGVWVGNNNNEPMFKQPGVILAGPIWHNFMEFALSKFPKESFSELIKTEPGPSSE